MTYSLITIVILLFHHRWIMTHRNRLNGEYRIIYIQHRICVCKCNEVNTHAHSDSTHTHTHTHTQSFHNLSIRINGFWKSEWLVKSLILTSKGIWVKNQNFPMGWLGCSRVQLGPFFISSTWKFNVDVPFTLSFSKVYQPQCLRKKSNLDPREESQISLS